MHELSIAQSIVDILLDLMKAHHLSEIQRVRLRIGALRAIDRQSLGVSFDVLTAESPLHGVRLEIEEIPMRGRCLHCGRQFPMGHWLDDCPDCLGPRVEIVSGKELEIVDLEGE